MTKISIIGSGSMVFATELMTDTLLTMRRGEITATLDPRQTNQEEVLRYMALGADPALDERTSA